MTEIIAQALGSAAMVGAAWLGLRGKLAEIGKNVGTQNGNGNVVQMSERILAGQAEQDARLGAIEHTLGEHGQRLSTIEWRVGG